MAETTVITAAIDDIEQLNGAPIMIAWAQFVRSWGYARDVYLVGDRPCSCEHRRSRWRG